MTTQLEWLPLFAVAFVTLVAAFTDIWKFKVYNVLTFPALLAGLAFSTYLGGLSGALCSLSGAIVGFASLVLFFALGGVGAGDVKLLTAVGAWLGPWLTFEVFVASALVAGLYALVLSMANGGLTKAVVEVMVLVQRIRAGHTDIRTGTTIEAAVHQKDRRRRLVPFAAATCLAFFVLTGWHREDAEDLWPPYSPNIAVIATTASDQGDLR
ncbi:A24 family peptidase [Singulisphaera sp. PoT]|uniref:A24 family peptidase n=1 Tax=Singulisphaera sp. PoT TaxID=3411797 RepID=UPI003BF4CA41